MKTIDCTGMQCPLPLIEAKRAISTSSQNDEIEILVDNETSLKNLLRFLRDNGYSPTFQSSSGKHRITFFVTKSMTKGNVEEYCETYIDTPSKHGNYIVVLKSNLMGNGNNDLGELLMKGFITTLSSLDKLPLEIICYNSGVLLAQKETSTALSLKKLADLGVKVVLCGTCVDFYGIKDYLLLGELSNMYYIAERISSGLHVVEP